MSRFDDQTLGWEGKDYVIPANHVLEAVVRIESVVTLHELLAYAARRTAPMGKLSQAYGAVLRYAGAKVTDEDVYFGMTRGEQSDDVALQALTGLLQMMLPKDEGQPGDAAGNLSAGSRPHRKGSSRRRKKARASSRRSTPSSSATSS